MNPWYLNSTTIRAGVATLVPVLILILKAFGLEIGTEEQSKLIDGLVAVIGLIASIHVLIGRIRAQRKIEKSQ